MAKSFDSAEQDELLRRAAGGDQASQERLVEAFMPTVVRMASARAEPGVPVGDLVQEGAIGLIEAIRTFSGSGEADFGRFAEAHIAAQLTTALEAEAESVRDELLLVTAAEDYDRVELILARELHRAAREVDAAVADLPPGDAKGLGEVRQAAAAVARTDADLKRRLEDRDEEVRAVLHLVQHPEAEIRPREAHQLPTAE